MKKYAKIIIVVVGIIAIIALLILIYFKVAFISKNEVKEIVIDNMEVSSSDVYFESIDFEMSKGVYEVELYYQNNDYEYKIDAKEGKVIYTDFVTTTVTNDNSLTDDTTSNSQNGVNQPAGNISLEEATNIALTNANLSADSVRFLRTEMEYENNTLIYEIDFTHNDFEYDYKISAMTGEIISYDKDSIYD